MLHCTGDWPNWPVYPDDHPPPWLASRYSIRSDITPIYTTLVTAYCHVSTYLMTCHTWPLLNHIQTRSAHVVFQIKCLWLWPTADHQNVTADCNHSMRKWCTQLFINYSTRETKFFSLSMMLWFRKYNTEIRLKNTKLLLYTRIQNNQLDLYISWKQHTQRSTNCTHLHRRW